MRLSDILAANAALGVFQLGHVLFFFNPWLDYNALYGVGYGVACATGCALFDWQDSGGLSWSTAGAGFAFVCCVWYALETHAFAARAADGRAGCCSVVLCFAYADAWNAASKCGGAKSSGATTASEQLAA